MVQHLFFTATEATAPAGTNQGFVYAPATLQNQSYNFDLMAGESILVVPQQPAGHGPWKIYQSTLVNGDLKTFLKSPKVFVLKLTNKWITKSIRIGRFCFLDAILAHPGIAHTYGTMPFDDLTEINDTNDDEEDDDEKPAPDACVCTCCLKQIH